MDEAVRIRQEYVKEGCLDACILKQIHSKERIEMLFFINRKIFNSLNYNLQLEYIKENIINTYGYIEHAKKLSEIVRGIIISNEEWHTKYGSMQKNGRLQCTEETMVPAWSTPSGHGEYADINICPFDWSWDENGDFDYCFYLSKTIKEKE